ncbi:MAG: MerR family transcriptional regulator [Pyrinomonadaceae bacterium]
MKPNADVTYQAADFAALAGVTVRTLHHYHRVGLLKPSGRTGAGYRIYRQQDLVRLQQIVTLKFIGFSLRQIIQLLNSNAFDLSEALNRQKQIIAEKRQQLTEAIEAIEKAQKLLTATNEPDWQAFKRIIEVINNMDWTNKYYTEEAKRKISERAQTIPREVIEQAQREWTTLIREVETAVTECLDPASEKAAALAARWTELLKGFTGDDAEIQAGLNKMYDDRDNWPKTFPKPYSDAAGEFISATIAARQTSD